MYSPTLIAFILATLTAHTFAAPAAHYSELYTSQPSQPGVSNSYSGAGGQANGGSVSGPAAESADGTTDNLLGLDNLLANKGGLVNLFSDNGGSGGNAGTGAAGSTTGRSRIYRLANGDSYSGAGGQSSGGQVTNSQPAVIKLFSGNGGDGGGSDSGDSGGSI